MTLKTYINPIKKHKLHDEIVGQIQKNIIEGTIKPEEKLPPERILAERFQVNRSTVREALKKLEMLNLIKIKHGDGIYVKNYFESGNLEVLKNIIQAGNKIHGEYFENLLAIRKILVPEMAFIAAQKRSNEDIKSIQETMENENQTIAEKDLKIHHKIAIASKNIFYIFILNFFNDIFRDYGYLYFDNETNANKTREFHQTILEAIINQNAQSAKKIMLDILVYSEEQTLLSIKSKIK